MQISEVLDEEKIQGIYNRLLEYARTHEVNSDLTGQLSEWQGGKWRNYIDQVLKQIPLTLTNKKVVDFGCRYGLLFPLLLELGVSQVIGIDDLDLFLQPARQFFQENKGNVKFLKSDCGYIPLQPDTVDLVIVNEVISHVHPTFLPIVYSEIARILVMGGMLFISDGNNLAHRPFFDGHLVQLYDAIENGPDGIQRGDVKVQSCFVNQRKQIIQRRCPALSAEQVEFLSVNTSGLHGDYLNQVIDCFAKTGEIIRRPFRKGIPPVYPEWGQVEERGFYPEQVALELMGYGFKCQILNRYFRFPAVSEPIFLDTDKMEPATGYMRHAYQMPIPKEYPKQFPVALLEDGQPLLLPSDNHSEISEVGMGRYSIWRANNTIYFSSSDNSDPRTNGRKYELQWVARMDDHLEYASPNFQIVATKIW